MSEQDALKSLLKPLVLFANSGEKVPEPDPSPKPAPTTKKRKPPPEPSPPHENSPKTEKAKGKETVPINCRQLYLDNVGRNPKTRRFPNTKDFYKPKCSEHF